MNKFNIGQNVILLHNSKECCQGNICNDYYSDNQKGIITNAITKEELKRNGLGCDHDIYSFADKIKYDKKGNINHIFDTVCIETDLQAIE